MAAATHLPRLRLLLALLAFFTTVIFAQQAALPLKSSSRWILDANNQRVKFRCVNWAGHQEANIPEGLDKQPVGYIVDWIKQQGFNCVRLTYSIDHALNGNTMKVADSFSQAAAAAGVPAPAMTGLYANVISKNPFIATATTRDVYTNVVDTLWEAGIMTILDNHVSKATWCCNLTDGNGWWDEGFGYNSWNSRFFKTQDWLTGLQTMAVWATDHPGVVAMSLRNEIREFLLQGSFNGRADWYRFIKQGGDIVHAANPDVLVVVGGVQSSTDLTHVRPKNKMLDTSGWAGKHVWEMHAYSFTVTFPDPFQNCDAVKAEYGTFSGFVLEQNKPYTGPLILSEFGVGMLGGSENGLNAQDDRYLKCLVSYMTSNDADWAVWALQGSYYLRDGNVDADETWGLMSHDWKGWRNEKFPGMLGDMWKVTQGP
ncbi:glycoside hydrolase family 5 protein [Apodospora peruviana]|uniref:Glycoside hydrolase family 5 protein n=1 Tax=Apodospora peruviana TaxID=516989 RepID=A0AAE0LZL8_9PEZI|nr:glycoside hydrolase family 5 protein [Apodospora peruviana]